MVDGKKLINKYRNDRDFIEAAYQAVLNRQPEAQGVKERVTALEKGAKRDVMLFEIATSVEGVSNRAEIVNFNLDHINLDKLICKEGKEFIEIVFVAILGRYATSIEEDNYLNWLGSGKLTKLDIIWTLMDSDEGKDIKTDVVGFKRSYYYEKIKRKAGRKIKSIPFLGKIIRDLWSLMHINRLVFWKSCVEQWIRDIERRIGNAEQGIRNTGTSLSNLNQRIEVIELKLEKLSSNIIAVEDEARLQKEIEKANCSIEMGMEYKKYEDKMRGTREKIMNRLKGYGGIVNKVKETNGDKLIAVDLGCGRGEWGELLQKEYGIVSMGVDSDESMLNACKDKGLNTVHADLVSYIQNAQSNSVDIITMFQVAEHLPIRLLIEVLRECSRVLREGGALIVETPNPENLIIGACNFYFDPTHIQKLPPALLQILVDGTGLEDSEIIRSHKYKAVELKGASVSENNAIEQISAFLNNYADYAVVAFKRRR